MKIVFTREVAIYAYMQGVDDTMSALDSPAGRLALQQNEGDR